MKKYRMGLSKKVLLNIILLSISLCVATCLVGYYQYKNTITRLYNENGYSVGDIILNNIDSEEITYYTTNWETNDYYERLCNYLDGVLIASNAKYIYIVVPEQTGVMRYVYDSSGMEFGSYDPISSYLDVAMNAYNNGERVKNNYIVRKSPKYGYLTSSILPIKNKSGNTVALLFVDIAMEVIESTLRMFIIRTILISLIFMAISCLFSYFYMNRTLINPLHLIEKCLTKFANNNATITDELNDIVSADELENLSSTIYSMEQTVVQYINQVTSITAEKERIGAELNVATQIQADMLPSIFPPFPDRNEFDIFAAMTPAKEVGGDFYDFFMIDDSHIGIVMADVSGKGVPAALFMVISKTLIKTKCQMNTESLSPAEILATVNKQLCENNKAEMFVTVWLGILNINTGLIKAANAGHEFPAIKHNGRYELLKDKHGFVLAGMENLKYKDYEIQLQPGDGLFIYTDGVTEATNSKNELFGTNRMLNAINKDPNVGCKDILFNVQSTIDEFVKDSPQFDDITMLCLEYYGNTKNEQEITVSAVIENQKIVTEFIDNYLEKIDCPLKIQMKIDIAIDELFSNIAFYAYDGKEGDITVKINKIPDCDSVEITFIDSGKAYNPLEKEDPDVTLSAEERKIGGLGIFIVKKNMDAISYNYINNQNVLTIRKNLF